MAQDPERDREPEPAEQPDPHVCPYCSQRLDDDRYYPYDSAECVANAQAENAEDK